MTLQRDRKRRTAEMLLDRGHDRRREHRQRKKERKRENDRPPQGARVDRSQRPREKRKKERSLSIVSITVHCGKKTRRKGRDEHFLPRFSAEMST